MNGVRSDPDTGNPRHVLSTGISVGGGISLMGPL